MHKLNQKESLNEIKDDFEFCKVYSYDLITHLQLHNIFLPSLKTYPVTMKPDLSTDPHHDELTSDVMQLRIQKAQNRNKH